MPMHVSITQAAVVLRNAKRVLVVGCSGGGKSTLSFKISERFDLEYLSYDRDVRWLPDWQVRDREEQRQIVTQLVKKDRWVMDGTTVSTFDLRLPRADLLIWVRVPRRVALGGIARRVLAYYGKVRIDMAEGCPEKLPDREFLTFIWTFEKQVAPRIVSGIDRFAPKLPVVTLRSRSEFAALVDG